MEQTHPSTTLEKVLIAGITPYFLEKGNVWFEENFAKILEARQTQAFFQENTLFLEKDQEYSLSELLRKLDELGYEKVFETQEPGEFSHLGGHVEVFPINAPNAIRIEFLGNRVETIERLKVFYDICNQVRFTNTEIGLEKKEEIFDTVEIVSKSIAKRKK